MEPVELLAAGAVMAVILGIGLVAHELSHAFALRTLGIDCEIRWLPDRKRGERGLESARGGLATVVPRRISRDLAPWRLRVASLMPLTLAVPVFLVVAGVVPVSVSGGDPVSTAATIAWLACALPSPQDFSVVWHAEEAIEQYAA